MKRKIRLTESDLHKIIKESVKKILKESDTGNFDDFYDGEEKKVWKAVVLCEESLRKNIEPGRILKMSPAEYVKMMVEKYHAIVTYSEDFSFVGFQWKNQADMRKFKNFINKEARTVNYQY